jgi:hypothetical protein
MDLSIRPAELSGAPVMAPLVNDADGGMTLAIWTSLARPGESPWDVGLRRVRGDDTPVSWRMGWIAEVAGRPVGVLIVHQLSETPEQLEATIMSPLWVPIVEGSQARSATHTERAGLRPPPRLCPIPRHVPAGRRAAR